MDDADATAALLTAAAHAADADDDDMDAASEGADADASAADDDGRRWLRHTGGGAAAEGLAPGIAAALDVLDASADSAFAAAVRAGEVERALLLYCRSLPRVRGGDDDPATVEMAERAAAGLDEAVPVRVRQLLLILLARRAWPEAGADRQFERISAAAGGWPAGGADDVTAGGEMKRVALAEQDGVEPPPPFVFIRECVPYDASPCWKKGALTDGCKCHAKGGPRSLSKLVCDKAGRSHGCCSAKHFECGVACACASTPRECDARVTQHGLQKQLELFATAKKGYGVRAAQYIPKGSFVIEYVGEYISSEEAERRERSCPRNNDYFFTFGARGSDGGVIIDAYAVRNLAAFINFSCGGDVCNLKAESVKAEHRDRSFPKVAFYATKDIHAGTELTYQRDVGATSRKSRSKVPCECGARGVNGQVLCHGYL